MRVGAAFAGVLVPLSLVAAPAARSQSTCDIYAQVSAPGQDPVYESAGPGCPAVSSAMRGGGFASSAANAGSAAVRGSSDTAFADANAQARLELLVSGPDLLTAVQVGVDVAFDLQADSHFDGVFHSGHAQGSLTLLRGTIPLPIGECALDVSCDAELCTRSRDCEGALEAACPDVADVVAGPSASIACQVSQLVPMSVGLPAGAPSSLALVAHHEISSFGDAAVRATWQGVELEPGYTVTYADGSPLPETFPPAEAPAPQIPAAPAAALAALAAALLFGARMSLPRA